MELIVAALEKYGPMGLALIVVCYALRLLVVRVLPGVFETLGKRLDATVEAVNRLADTAGAKLEASEAKAGERHGEIVGKLGGLDDKADKILDHLTAKKDAKSCGS